jgi:hypothetical protein
MLREIDKVKNEEPGTKRRWFQDDYFDLWIWEKPDETIKAFQLCYDRRGTERVFSWRELHGFDHLKVEFNDTEESSRYAKAALLMADGTFPMREVWRRLLLASRELPRDIRYFLFEKLFEYSDRGRPGPPMKKRVRVKKKKKH